MAPHDGAAQAEERSPLRLPNKIADSDPQKNQRIRQSIEHDVKRRTAPEIIQCFIQNLSILTTLVPSHWKKLPPELKQFVEKEMFDPVMRQVLEDDNIINWAPSATKLYPLITTGDGNCLLHAVSLAMWGLEDDNLFLRNLLHEALVNHDMECRRRWQRERKRQDERIPGSGLRYNTMEWRNEWEMVIKMSSSERRPPTTQGLPYECLEEFHVFMLANILRRPIIVMAQSMWHDLQGHSLQPQNFSGVYLPLKWQPEQCSKSPIILGYYQMHFVPLVYTGVTEGETSATEFVVPLIHQDHSPMVIHFLTQEEEGKEDKLLQDYLTLEELPHMDINESMASTHVIQGAQLSTTTSPDEMNLMVSYFRLVDSHYRFYLETEYNPHTAYKGANQTQELEDKMSKANVNSASLPPASDMWAPPTNPNYMSAGTSPNTQQGQATGELPRTKDSTANPQMIMSMINQNCKTKNCPYYRSISTGEYCHECYSKLHNMRKMGGDDDDENLSGPAKCRTEGCLNFSAPGKEHCQVCKASAKFHDNGGTATAPSAPLPSNVPLSSEQSTVVSNAMLGSREQPLKMYQPSAPLPSKEQLPSEQATVVSNAVLGSKQQQEQKIYQSAHISGGSDDDLTTLLVNTVKVGSKKCIMPECQLTGHPATHDLCQKCFDENRRIHENVMAQTGSAKLEQPSRVPQQMAEQNSAATYSRKCRTQGCQGIGNSHMSGYCAECAIKMSPIPTGERPNFPQNKEASPPSIPPPNYDQAIQILQNNATGGASNNLQQSQAAGYMEPSQQQQHPPQQQQNLGFTVQKHICATPGCSGIRLDAGYCWECERINKLAAPPSRTQTPPPMQKQSWVKAAPPRSQTPPATGQLQSAAGLGYPSRHQAQSTAYRAPAANSTRTIPLSHPSTRTCRHPKCDRPAAPPKYILCEECINVAELYKREEEGMSEQSNRPGTDPLLPPGTWSGEGMEHLPRNQASHVSTKPKASPSKNPIPQGRAYIPRHKCQARGGCKDDMYGDPELNNLCSSCFKDSLRRPPFAKPFDVHSAPVRPSARPPKRQTSHSQALPTTHPHHGQQQNRVVHVPSNTQAAIGNNVVIATGPNPAMVQTGQVPHYQKCAEPECPNPANPNILEGYCNTCYRAFEEVFVERERRSVIAHPAQEPPYPAQEPPYPAQEPPYPAQVPRYQAQEPRYQAQEPHYQAQGPRYQAPHPAMQQQSGKPYRAPADLPTPKPTRMPCKHSWCENYGNPKCFGYCNECYKLTQLNRSGQVPHY
ncbi:uncharacterized protein [Amphiura filiformis]|uniref:uncharacterized protein n=1 Tax=Amphiura filiformis TaxID=82378 RepID=UPI003B21916D